MCLFYIIHSLPWGMDMEHGKRNCRTFLIGVVLYVLLWIFIRNLEFNAVIGKFYDTLISAGIVILLADIAVMGYIYRAYFGRSIVYEISDNPNKNHIFDGKTHTYREPSLAEIKEEELKKQEILIRHEIKENQLMDQINADLANQQIPSISSSTTDISATSN